MPQFRPPPRQADRNAAAAVLAQLTAGQRVPTNTRDLIADAGGTRASAGVLGKSQRQMQRWARGEVHHLPADAVRRLTQAGNTSRMNQVIRELGGAKRVAELTGRHVSTVRDWASGRIKMPKPDARQKLGRADVAIRMKDKGVSVDPATGLVDRPVYVKLTGDVRVKGSSKSLDLPVVEGKNIGAWGGINVSADTMRDIVDALGVGNYRAAHEALEAWLTGNYASGEGAYDANRGIGLFIDRIDTVAFSHDRDATPPPRGPRNPGK